MQSGSDVENVIVESKFGILRDRVLVDGREFAVQRAGTGGATSQTLATESGVSTMTDGAIDCRSNRRSAPSRFASACVTRRPGGAGASTASARCLAIA